MKTFFKKLISILSSIQLGIITLVALFILTLVTTISQVQLGIYYSIQKYFKTWFVWLDLGFMNIPVFPAGLTVGWVMFINLSLALMLKHKWRKEKIGIWLIHVGIIIIIIGSGITAHYAKESQAQIPEGQTQMQSIDFHDVELAIINIEDPRYDQVIRFDESILKKNALLSHPELPFQIKVKDFAQNSLLYAKQSNALKQIAKKISFRETPIYTQDDRKNIKSARIEIIHPDGSGEYVASTGIESIQKIQDIDSDYYIQLRYKRYYFPFYVRLKDFDRQLYAGTNTPKSFRSKVDVLDLNKDLLFEADIYMNHPLRFSGYTLFQASFAENDTVSIFQVVKNPSWLLPYIGCLIASIGFIWHFIYVIFRKRVKQ